MASPLTHPRTPLHRTNVRRHAFAVEFGLMHVVLLQLLLLPLTVSRSLLAWIGTRTTAIPLEHIMNMHIQCGYVCCLSLLSGALLYLGVVGHLCQVPPLAYPCHPFVAVNRSQHESGAASYAIFNNPFYPRLLDDVRGGSSSDCSVLRLSNLQEYKDGHEHEDAFCSRFKTEIMITGYAIVAFFLVILVTAYFRARMKYEHFFFVSRGPSAHFPPLSRNHR
jgi:hypothetical protein